MTAAAADATRRVVSGAALLVGLSLAFALALQAFPPRLTLYVCAFAAIAIACLAVVSDDGRLDVLHPALGLFVLLFLYSVSSALFTETEHTTFFGEVLMPQVYAVYYLTCIAGVAGLALGLALRRLRGAPPPQPMQVDPAANRDLWITLLACCAFLCLVFLPWIAPRFDFVAVRSYYETALASRVERLADDAAGVTDVLTQYLPLTLLLGVCAQAVQQATLPPAVRALAGVVFGAYVVTGFLAGERYTVLYCGLVLLAWRDRRVAPVRLLPALSVGAVAYLLMNLIPIIRGSTDPTRMLQALQDAVAVRGLQDFSLTYSNELLTAVNLHRHIQGMQLGETAYNWGYSVLTDLLVWVPRLLYPNRPLPTSEQFVETFYPGVRDLGGGYGFFILQEGYWAFGVAGAFVFMFAFGWLLDGLYRVARRFERYDLAVLLYAAVYADLVMASVRSGIVGSFKAAMLHAIPFAFVLAVHAARLQVRRLRAESGW